MEKKFEMTRCEHCAELIGLESPPSIERYEKAEILIENGYVLLPDSIVEANKKEGISSGHTENISGRYCTPQCLVNKLNSILTIPLTGVKKEMQQAMEKYAKCMAESLKKDKRYLILEATTISYLESKINECTGYTPIGGISSVYDSGGDDGIEYLQLMERI